MELIRGLHNLRTGHRGSAVTIGTFDGVHLGHQAMIARLRERARERAIATTVLTFEPTPREYLDPANAPARLTRLREKLPLLERAGVDRCIVMRFDEHLRTVRGPEFVARLLIGRLDTRLLVVGPDFRFGYRGEATVDTLRQGAAEGRFALEVMDPVLIAGERVSSSGIRAALAERDLANAERMLGRRYSMQGKVVAGEKLGRKLGFPTANMRVQRRVTPLAGIYAVQVHGIGAQGLPGVASLGTRPTIDGRELLLEAHVFDFAGDLYRRRLEVEFVRYLREEERFENLEALVAQMHEDARQARAALIRA
jgi:riboflavin kinase/FMN adenylyltransferase